MIQRIQSVYLFLVALIASLLYLPSFSFVQSSNGVAKAGIWADGRFNAYDNISLLILTGGIAGIALFTLFMYKNRKAQIKMTYLLMFLIVVVMAIIAWFLYQNINPPTGEKQAVTVNLGLIIPILTAILVLLARKYIRRDEGIVRSMDRLR